MVVYFVEAAYTDDLNQSWTEAMFDSKIKAKDYICKKSVQEENSPPHEMLSRWMFEVDVCDD